MLGLATWEAFQGPACASLSATLFPWRPSLLLLGRQLPISYFCCACPATSQHQVGPGSPVGIQTKCPCAPGGQSSEVTVTSSVTSSGKASTLAEQGNSLEKVRFAPSEALGGEGVCCPEQGRG